MVWWTDPEGSAMSSALRDAVEREMRLRGFAPKTHDAYIHAEEDLV